MDKTKTMIYKTVQKTADCATGTPLKKGDEFRGSRRGMT
jgi:hypothetical protein